MNIAKKWILTTVLAGSMIGGAVGGTLIASSVITFASIAIVIAQPTVRAIRSLPHEPAAVQT